ncbi:MAG: hypothetical protein ABIQ88_16740 [Chitinophagaceae bacterium]
MKYVWQVLLTGIITISFACSKPAENGSVLVGKWQWTNSVGEFAGNDVLQPASNGMVSLMLKEDSTYAIEINNQPAEQGKYALFICQNKTIIRFDKTIVAGRLYLQYEQSIPEADKGKLRLYDYNITDGFNHHFEKVNQ